MTDDHRPVPGTEKPLPSGAARIGGVDPDSSISLTLSLRGPDLPAVGTPDARTHSPEELAADYGASDADIAAVRDALERRDLHITDTSSLTRSVRVEGTARAVQDAFGVELGQYEKGGRDEKDRTEFRGQEGQVHVPAEIAGVVTGVFGFDERQVAFRRSAPAATPTAKPAPLTPQDLEQRYSFPAGDASGQTVAVAEFGGAYFAEDVRAFCAAHGLPDAAERIRTVSIDHQPVPTLADIRKLPPNLQEQWLAPSGEVMMDVEIVAGLAPGADVVVYFARFSQKGWLDLLDRVMHDRPASLSISWGSAEDVPAAFSPAAVQAIDVRLRGLAALGVTVCVSSGDDGSGDDGNDDRCHVDFPASSRFVLAVGGTEIKNGEEVAWFDAPGTRFDPQGNPTGGGATGGGVSTVFARPPWQDVTVARADGQPAFDGRVVPDVAALAGRPFYDLVLLGKDAPNGGTSASAPLWASLVARAQAAIGATDPTFLAPLLYRAGVHACRDISVGENTSSPDPGVGYAAGTGFDAVTGWGVPIGDQVVAALRTP